MPSGGKRDAVVTACDVKREAWMVVVEITLTVRGEKVPQIVTHLSSVFKVVLKVVRPRWM